MLLNPGFDTARAQRNVHNASDQPQLGLASKIPAYFGTARSDTELRRFVKLHGPFGRYLP